MTVYRTPGVYVEEISTLPPSVAEVATAIPAFIGYTEKTDTELARITSLREFETTFGGPELARYSATTDEGEGGSRVLKDIDFIRNGKPDAYLYYAMALYFQNGGGACYVCSIGGLSTAPNKNHFFKGLELVEAEDEPTLLVMPEAVRLANADYAEVCKQALAQCGKLKDRFAILDVKADDKGQADDKAVEAFRNGVGMDQLSYGAAYHPYVTTTLVYRYDDTGVTVKLDGDTSNRLSTAPIKNAQTMLYNQIKTELGTRRVVLPPSAAIAGVYARVDRDRGVWKAPANVSMNGVIAPTMKITNDVQDGLNVDATAGKSINAIRAFAGKGILVWGARTLAGNDNEWRYVPVRRLFVMIEESVQKSTAFAVFEPNDASTWLKVKGMIESYLYGLWERGALQGSTPDQAYFVNVGLGNTMTAQDILEGRMIVEIGIAAVRPAEFIILRFEHKLPEA